MKLCSRCKEEKPLSEFYRNRTRKDGLGYRCKPCQKAHNKQWRGSNREHNLSQQKEYYSRNKERAAERHRQWIEENREHFNSYMRAQSAQRRAAKLARTPPWADLDSIKAFYMQTPEGHHVDHIIPLQGKAVSGLHVLENLQYLPVNENLSKSNSFHASSMINW